MKSIVLKISIMCVLIVTCTVQDPQPIVTDQNFIDPTVVGSSE